MHDALTQLIEEGKQLVTSAAKIQDFDVVEDDFPSQERKDCANQTAECYHSWHAKAVNALPKALETKFEELYKGSFFSSKIKSFLEGPLEINPLWENEDIRKLLNNNPFNHPYDKCFRAPLQEQISLLERQLHVQPGILRLADGEVRLPRNLQGHTLALYNFLETHPYDRNVFIMMKYRDSNEQLRKAIMGGIRNAEMNAVIASDENITDELATNVMACLLCSKYGVALFDDPEEGQHINPNVAYELGIMHYLGRQCLILKSSNLKTLPSDILAKLYTSYTPNAPMNIVDQVENWLTPK